MKLNTKNGVIFVKTTHYHYKPAPQEKMSSGPVPLAWVRNGYTVVIFCKGGITIGTGTSICSVHDQFNKRIGRKIAFSRALANMNFDKADRTEIWKQYRASTIFK